MFCQIISLAMICLCIPLHECKVQYIVEDTKQPKTPHLHPIRKGTKTSPYKSAASITTNANSAGYESFSLNCPHVSDARNKEVKMEVTWTVNETIWLKIEDGNQRIYNKLTTFTKKTVNGKSVLRVMLNNGRYFFDYNELSGEFSMEIRPVSVVEDAGVWQCHVTVQHKDDIHRLTSRSRVKGSHPHRHNPEERKQAPVAAAQIKQKSAFTVNRINDAKAQEPTADRVRYFTRDDGGVVHISRDDTHQQSMVVFNRQASFLRNRVIKHVPDYESLDTGEPLDHYDSTATEDDEEEIATRSRTRSTAIRSHSSPNNSSLSALLLFSILHLFV